MSSDTLTTFGSGVVSGVALLAAIQYIRHQHQLRSTHALDASNPEELRHPAHALTDLIIKYRTNLNAKDEHRGNPAKSSSYPVRIQKEPGWLVSRLPSECPTDPESYASIFADVEKLIFPSLSHWAAPTFGAYFKCNGSDPSALADFLCAAMNVVGFSWVAAPAATELETVVVDWMAKLLNLPAKFLSTTHGGGVIQGSASESALCAMIAARQRVLQTLDEDETAILPRLCVYVSDQTHALAQKGCMILKIPNLRVIETKRGEWDDNNYGLSPTKLEKQMQKDIQDGLIPFFVCATVGTTATCAIDPIQEIATVAHSVHQQAKVWVHVDGAFGAAGAVCPEYQKWLNGVSDVESLCVNSHKWLMAAFDCSLLWLEDRRPLIQSLALDPEILKNDFMSQIQYKDWQLPLGRRFRALKLWFTMRRFGAVGLQEHIRTSIRHAKLAEELLLEDGRFDLFVPTRMALVCFNVKFGGREVGERLLRKVNESGKTFLIHAVVDGIYFIRIAIGGSEIQEWHVRQIVQVIQQSLTEVMEEKTK